MAYIYTLEDPISNEIRYIGVTINTLEKRNYDHCSKTALSKANSRRITWIKSLRNKNLKPVIKLLVEVPDEIRYKEEEFYISLFKSWGFNLVNSNNGGSGGVYYKQKTVYRHTEETKKKIGLANKRPKSKEWIRNAARGSYKSIIQLTKDHVFIREYESTTTAAIELGNINKKKNISQVLNGLRPSASGYYWKFKV